RSPDSGEAGVLARPAISPIARRVCQASSRVILRGGTRGRDFLGQDEFPKIAVILRGVTREHDFLRRMNLPKSRVILSGVSPRAKAGRHGVEESRGRKEGRRFRDDGMLRLRSVPPSPVTELRS